MEPVHCTGPWGVCCCLLKWLTGFIHVESLVIRISGTGCAVNQRQWGTSEWAVGSLRLFPSVLPPQASSGKWEDWAELLF